MIHPDLRNDFVAKTNRQLNRRDLLRISGASLLGSTLTDHTSIASDVVAKPNVPICVFAKPLQQLSFDELALQLAKWDIAGVEATVRRGGQVDPAQAKTELSKLYDSLAKVDRNFVIMATDINSADSPHVEDVLETASKLGIRYFRLAYYQYDLSRPIIPQLESFAKQAQSLAAICRTLGVQGLYQNHAGSTYVGAPVWDLLELLKNIPTEEIGVALDIRHTTVEAPGTWPLAYSAVKSRMASVFVKDAIVTSESSRDVPLGQGPLAKALFQKIKSDGIPGPISLQMEHIDHTNPALLNDRIHAITRDLDILHNWLDKE